MRLTFLERRGPYGRAQGLVLGAVTSLFLFGCGDRPQPPAGATPSAIVSSAERDAFATRLLAEREEAHQRAVARAAAAPPVVWPAPVATATGGRHIDLRGIHDHVHTLERQPDGTWRPLCRDARTMAPGSGR